MIQANGTVLACGEGSYGRLGQGNSDDLHVLTVISALQGMLCISALKIWSVSHIRPGDLVIFIHDRLHSQNRAGQPKIESNMAQLGTVWK